MKVYLDGICVSYNRVTVVSQDFFFYEKCFEAFEMGYAPAMAIRLSTEFSIDGFGLSCQLLNDILPPVCPSCCSQNITISAIETSQDWECLDCGQLFSGDFHRFPSSDF